ncbi:MAG: efflux RND transporter permease subunit, partial [Clostridia bacterium]|nr:efflux RND transporter permease subunit [Clostridia bacterium]
MVLADISLKRPVFITVIIIALLVVGILCYTGLNINDMPQADFPYVTATVIQIGASPDQLESKVAKKIEEAVGQISGVKHIQSIIQDNVSTTVIEFVLDKSPDVAAQEVRDKISSVRGELPQDIKEPVIAKYDIGAHPIISLAVTGSLENLELSQLTEDVITKKLQTLKGVGAVNTFGSVEREIHIKLDKERLAAYGLTTAQVINSLKSDNIEAPGGKVANGDREISLKTNASIKQVKDFNDILVAVRNGTEIRVRDVAEVIDSIKEKENMSFY